MKYTLLIEFDNELPEQVQQYYLDYNNTHEDDSGVDIVCPFRLAVSVYDVKVIDFKIRCAMVKNHKYNNDLTGYYLYPRSSISNTPLMLANHVGIIDAGYRGNLKAKVRCLPRANACSDKYIIEENTRLFQLCAPDLSQLTVKVVDKLPNSDRGACGFGSTGICI